MFPELLLRKAFPRRGRKKPWQASASKSPIVGRGVGASRVTFNIKLPPWVARLNGHQGEVSELAAFAAEFSTRAVKRESRSSHVAVIHTMFDQKFPTRWCCIYPVTSPDFPGTRLITLVE